MEGEGDEEMGGVGFGGRNKIKEVERVDLQ